MVQSRRSLAFAQMSAFVLANRAGPVMSNTILSRAPEDGAIIQAYGTLGSSRLGLGEAVRAKSIGALNRLVAHSMALRDLYKKAHWQTSGATFYGLHLMFDKHYGEQLELVDALAERVQTLGGVALALAHDVVEATTAPTISSSARSCARTSCRAGSSPSTCRHRAQPEETRHESR
jgi:starvation-inducible DNA-binding protein